MLVITNVAGAIALEVSWPASSAVHAAPTTSERLLELAWLVDAARSLPRDPTN